MADFLLEIGTEEIPARMIDAAREELVRRVADLLTRERLVRAGDQGEGEKQIPRGLPPQHTKSGRVGNPGPPPQHAKSARVGDPGQPARNDKSNEEVAIEAYSTPRRLAIVARAVAEAQHDIEEQVTGPSLKVAYKDGQPTPAALAFAKKVDLPVEKLEKVTTAKGEYLAAKVMRRGRQASEILAEALPKEIAGIYWPKTMYWRVPTERFIRPVRWLVATLDGKVVPLEFEGISAGRTSRGHRTLGTDVTIEEPTAYASTLKQAGVIGRGEERRELIRSLLDRATRTIPGARWREDKELVETVVNLTELPSVILGSFDREFLALADEVLVTVMRDHQKYFAVEEPAGKLIPQFLAVLNTDADPEGIIRHGHERVLRARFNDARFFWQTDQKIPLRQRVQMLKAVTFQKDLGSYYEKSIRVQRLASTISQALKDAGTAVRPGVVHKAALLAKTDLTTELVKEFTELQGIVGGLYARAQHLDPEMSESAHEAIAVAIYDHYKPESMEDAVPRTVEGAVLSIADKADSIAGMFALGMAPSGSKDPFALRRQANGIVKTTAEHKLPLSLATVFTTAREMYAGSEAEKKFAKGFDYTASLRDFFRERLEFYLREVRGFAYDVVNAALAAGADDVVDALARAEAVAQVRGSEDFEHISIAFKRIKNILRQAKEKGFAIAGTIDRDKLKDEVALRLYEARFNIATKVQAFFGRREYFPALLEMAQLRPIIDEFFDHVMVMVDEEDVRANRLRLLQSVLEEFSTIADFSEIVTEGK